MACVHVSSTRSSSIPRICPAFAALGVACSSSSRTPRPTAISPTVSGQRKEGAYAFRSLWDSGAVIANGSDAPVEDLDPLLGLRSAVVRSLDDRPPWRPGQALTVEQALLASTVNAAWLAGDEKRRGRLVPGQLADLVVLDRDPLACEQEELERLSVVATMVGGRWVHNPPPW